MNNTLLNAVKSAITSALPSEVWAVIRREPCDYECTVTIAFLGLYSSEVAAKTVAKRAEKKKRNRKIEIAVEKSTPQEILSRLLNADEIV